MWNNTAADSKQPDEKKGTKQKEKCHRISLHIKLKESLMQQKRSLQGWKEQEKQGRGRRQMGDEDEEDGYVGSSAVFSLSVKHLSPFDPIHSFKKMEISGKRR